MLSTLSAIATAIDWERIGLAVVDVVGAIVGELL